MDKNSGLPAATVYLNNLNVHLVKLRLLHVVIGMMIILRTRSTLPVNIQPLSFGCQDCLAVKDFVTLIEAYRDWLTTLSLTLRTQGVGLY
jgi:hypothetical protein